MERMRLDVEALAVESFEVADRVEAEAALARTQFCSAIDACPSRLCPTNVC